MNTDKKIIGLALSGGGVLGASHIGVIEELEKNKIKPNIICGVSAGSIIGGVYASKGVDGLDKFYKELIRNPFLNSKKQLQIISPNKFFNELENILGEFIPNEFSKIPVKFCVVATNLSTGKPDVISSGNPIKAILASCAYPGVFGIQKINESYYIDGGVTLNLPAQPIRDKCDFLIGSSIYNIDKISDKKLEKFSRASTLARTLQIIEMQLSANQENYCDYIFKPSTENLKWFQFWKIDEVKSKGRIYAKENIKGLIYS